MSQFYYLDVQGCRATELKNQPLVGIFFNNVLKTKLIRFSLCKLYSYNLKYIVPKQKQHFPAVFHKVGLYM